MGESVRKTIIVVDDDPAILDLLESSFHVQGFEVKTFLKGLEALHFLLDENNVKSVCLLILDRLLPDSEGLEILKQFQDKYQNQIPVLILSGLSSEKDVLEGLKKGAVDYITKPFSAPVLIEKALSLIRKNHG